MRNFKPNSSKNIWNHLCHRFLSKSLQFSSNLLQPRFPTLKQTTIMKHFWLMKPFISRQDKTVTISHHYGHCRQFHQKFTLRKRSDIKNSTRKAKNGEEFFINFHLNFFTPHKFLPTRLQLQRTIKVNFLDTAAHRCSSSPHPIPPDSRTHILEIWPWGVWVSCSAIVWIFHWLAWAKIAVREKKQVFIATKKRF